MLGESIEKKPELVKRVYSEGHEVGNHSWSHTPLVFKSTSFMRNEISRTDDAIRKTGYTGKIYFRAPYGVKLFTLPWVLSQENRLHILFDFLPNDWSSLGADVVEKRILDQVSPGFIILLHDGGGDRSETVVITDSVIKKK